MCKSFCPAIILINLFTFCLNSVFSWDFAVSTGNKILFYNSTFTKITEDAHRFTSINVLTYNEIENKIYFNDLKFTESYIFELDISPTDFLNSRTNKLMKKYFNEKITGIAYDPIDDTLYWSDSETRKIYRLVLNNSKFDEDKAENLDDLKPEIFYSLKNDSQENEPQRLALDLCNRYLYFINYKYRDSKIERISLDVAGEHNVIVDKLYMPIGLTIDYYTNRLLWTDTNGGSKFFIQSSQLDGTKESNVFVTSSITIYDLTFDERNIYFTDNNNDFIWSLPKNNSDNRQPIPVIQFSLEHKPGSIIRKNNLIETKNPHCEKSIKIIEEKIQIQNSKKNFDSHFQRDDETLFAMQSINEKDSKFCFNNGELNPKTGECRCTDSFTGRHCEIPTCYNYCLNDGNCNMNEDYPKCSCQIGFKGSRCEINLCLNYCLNGGTCSPKHNEPICKCVNESYTGLRCEQFDEISFNNEVSRGKSNADENLLPPQQQPLKCYGTNNSFNKTLVFTSLSLTASFVIILVIILFVCKTHKTLRPRIKKTYVVQKNLTPLTSRPLSPITEQCQITIEDCCNMNICDTPCFDPKYIQEHTTSSISNNSNGKKEDKRTLIDNMESCGE
uniref:Protein cueball n=1 Tax=Corethrella appendiculata TaxID=1370023 RepID=U5EZR2_9DIPT